MPKPLKINDRLEIPGADLDVEVTRSGGPGGQHVNTTDSAVRLRFNLEGCAALHPAVKQRLRDAFPSRLTSDGELLVESRRHRSQLMNLDDAYAKLADMVRAHLKPPRPRKKTRPTKASKERRLKAKNSRSQTKKMRGRPRRDD